MGAFPFVPPPLYVMHPSVSEHLPLHSKSLCKNMARATEVANNMCPQNCGHKRKVFKRCKIKVLNLFEGVETV